MFIFPKPDLLKQFQTDVAGAIEKTEHWLIKIEI